MPTVPLHSTQREKDADRSKSADELVAQVRRLLDDGVPPSQITIVGASKGAVITMIASTRLQNRDVGYVILGNNDWVLDNIEPRLSGRVLSIYEETDEFGHTCGPIFARGSSALEEHEEIALHLSINRVALHAAGRMGTPLQ
ncbi:MAG: hypothetical protein M3Q69_06000 [Acidobacteriota bacterium]|nr:hypothetical protein [Acidobacteriota bacterium]